MDLTEILLYSIFAVVGGIVLLIFGFITFNNKRLIENIPTSKIRSIAMGLVEIFGSIAKAHEKYLTSPFTDKKCVYYSYSIEEERKSEKSTYWVTIKRGKDSALFYLRDDTGEVLVNPEGAVVDVPYSFNRTGTSIRMPKEVINFMESNRVNYRGFIGLGKRMRFKEYIVEPNQKLYIMGTADDNPYVETGTSEKNSDNVIIKKGAHNKFFYISNKPEKELLKTFALKMWLLLIGGSLLIIGGATYIFIYLNII
ncbi:MAG: GIDE domain-containing protein [Candidatus Nanoarchaeia archaeon]|nr:GIDE domain-containing protein [Candidatus Nanoarchaeia archaeon]